jgi:hypothetical protein
MIVLLGLGLDFNIICGRAVPVEIYSFLQAFLLSLQIIYILFAQGALI